MEALAAKRNIALLKVDIASWDSPAAKQFSLRSIPHLIIYDASGQVVAEGRAAYDYLNRL